MELPASNPKHIVRFADAAREVGLSRPTLRKLCREGKGPPLLRLSTRCYGIRRGELDAWLESRDVVGPQLQR